MTARPVEPEWVGTARDALRFYADSWFAPDTNPPIVKQPSASLLHDKGWQARHALALLPTPRRSPPVTIFDDKAVEAAARALLGRQHQQHVSDCLEEGSAPGPYFTFDDLDDEDRDLVLAEARAVLEAYFGAAARQ